MKCFISSSLHENPDIFLGHAKKSTAPTHDFHVALANVRWKSHSKREKYKKKGENLKRV